MGILSPISSPSSLRGHERRQSLRLTSVPQALVLMMGDGLSLFGSYLLTSVLLSYSDMRPINFQATVVWGTLWMFWRAYQGLYPGYGRSPQTELRLHVVGTLQICIAQLAASFAVQRFASSVLSVLLEWLCILLLGLTVRYWLRGLLIRFWRFGRDVSVIGAGRTAELAIVHLKAHPAYGLNPIVAYDDNTDLHGQRVGGVLIEGPIESAFERPQTEHAIISIPGARAEVIQRLVNTTYAVFHHTWIVPDLFGVPNQALQPHYIGIVASLEVGNNLRSVRSRAIKRLFDFVLSVLGLVVIAPVFLVIALLIRLDSKGAVLYKAPRVGRHMAPFSCFKFRSMYEDADERLHHLLETDPSIRDEYETYHKLRNDPRVTRVGAFLRKFSLDELPQVLNVLAGEMSLVGPRPYLPREQCKMGEATHFIAQVRPGMTGYWQVSGRNSSTFEERLDMDRFYITNWTPWLDFVILVQTVRVVLQGKGAY